MATEEEFELTEKRFESMNERLALGVIGLGGEVGVSSFTKDQILEHTRLQDEIGEEFVKLQLNFLRKLKERSNAK